MEVQLRKIEVPDWSVGQCAFRLLSKIWRFLTAQQGAMGFRPEIRGGGVTVAKALSQRTTGRSERAPLVSFVS